MLGRRTLLVAALAAPAAYALPARRILVPVSLDGRLANMVLDTGAEISVLTLAAALRLGLKFDPWVQTTMRGAGGRLETHQNADVTHAMFGGVRLFQRPEARGLSLAVTRASLGGADGLLGGDILRHFTLDVNFPAATLSRGAIQTQATVPLQRLWPDLLLAPVLLDGHPLIALLDTGATTSLINARGLHHLDLAPAALARDPATTTAALGGALTGRLHRFNTLRLGPLVLANPTILTAPVPEPAFDVILGMDVLGLQRVVINYASLTLGFAQI